MIPIGYRVYETYTDERGHERERPISRVYTVKSAAEDFARLAQKDHPTAFLREVYEWIDVHSCRQF